MKKSIDMAYSHAYAQLIFQIVLISTMDSIQAGRTMDKLKSELPITELFNLIAPLELDSKEWIYSELFKRMGLTSLIQAPADGHSNPSSS